jgi:hypothetical protein
MPVGEPCGALVETWLAVASASTGAEGGASTTLIAKVCALESVPSLAWTVTS